MPKLAGSGTEAEPYLINNVADLVLFRDSVNKGETKYNAPGVWVALAADIDMAGENWVGIGSITQDHGFMGNFDGKTFKIKNLTINNPTLNGGYAYAGFFSITEGTETTQNIIKNLTIENVTISTIGHIVSAAIAYPYYTIVENVNVCGDINITGGDYTAGALAYTRRCVNASNVSVVGNSGSTITGGQAVGGVISDIQMNGGLTANYSNFAAENLTITGTKMVGGISGIIATQTLNGATVENVTINCDDRAGQVAGSFGGTCTISNIVVENIAGADAIIGGGYDGSKPVEAKLGDTFYSTFAEAYSKATAGDTITLLADMTASDIIVLDKAITLDGNGKTLTSTAARAINVSGADGVTIKNLTINASGERAINIIQNATNVTIDNVIATAANYTVNVASSAPNAVVAIKNSTLNGLCTVNVSAAGADVTVDNSTVNCNDNNTTAGESYAALSLNKEAVGGSIIATNTTVNVAAGSDSKKGRNGAENGTVTINGSADGVAVMVAVIASDSDYYYAFASLESAIEFAKAGDTIKLLRDVTASDIIVLDKAITLDGNGKTLTSTAGRAINVSGADGVTIKNLTINASGERAINIIQNATNVTIDNVTATAANYTINVASSAPNAVVAIKNSTLNGLCTVNVSAAGAKVTVDNSTVNCNDNNTTAGESYAALCLNKAAIGGSIIATNTTVNVTAGSDSTKGRNGAENGTVIINGSTEGVTVTVAVITYPGSDNYYGFTSLAAAIEFAKAGDTITLIRDVTTTSPITITKSLTIDGGNHTLTYTGTDRAIDVPVNNNAKVNVTIENLTIDCTASYCQRGINYNDDGALVLNNVTVKGTNVTYALNLPGYSDNCVVEITDSSLTGNIALNVWGANSRITADNSVFTSVDKTTAEGYVAISLNNDGAGNAATGSVVTINGGKIIAKDENGDASTAVRVETTATVNVSAETEVVGDTKYEYAIVIYEGSTDFYSFDNLQDAIDKAIATNGKVVLINNITTDDIIIITAPVVIDGNGFTLTSTAARAINVSGANGVTIKNLTINASGERAINIIQNATNVTIDNVTATAANYTVNVAASAPNAVVAIKNSTLNGLCTVNVSAAGAVVTVQDSTVNCNDNNTTAGESYAALSLNKDAVGGSIVATNTTVNVAAGSDSKKGRNGAENGTVTINGSTDGVAVMVAVIASDSDYYYAFASLESAIEFAKAGDTIKFIRDVTASDIIVLDKAITLDGNGKKLTSTAGRAINVSGADGVTIKNLTIDAKGERAINIIQGATNVTIDNVTATAANYTVNVAASAPEAVVTITDSNLTGLNVVNVASAGAEVTVTGGTITCNDQSDVENYAALFLNPDAVNGKITATGVTFDIKGDSKKASNVAEGGVITIDGTTEGVSVPVAIITYGNNAYTFTSLADAISFAKAGETITLLRDVTASEVIQLNKSLIINGAGHKVSSSATRVFRVITSDVEVTMNEVNVESTAVRVGTNDIRGIAVDPSLSNVKLTLNNCSVDFTDDSATDWAYAVNVAGNGTGHTITVNGGSYEGANVINVYGAKNTVTVTDATLTSNYPNADVYYGSCIWVLQNQGSSVTATNNTFNGANAVAFNLGIGTALTESSNTDNTTRCVAKIGDQYYTSLKAAFAAAQDGDEVKILIAGTYALATSGKNITITGAVDGVVFDNIGEHNMGGASMTFNNVTFNYAMNSMYKGLQHSGNLVYNNCTINGQVFLYGDSETFNNCVFNQEDPNSYNVWTYSADPVAFKNCTFNCKGKSVLIYHENASVQNNVTVTDCDFIAYNAVAGKAAIEMDSSLTAGITLTIDAATTATGFGTGNVSGNSLWNNKKGQTTTANNDITVVVGGETVLQPITLTKLYIRMVDGEPRLGADVAPLKLEAKVNLDDPSWVEIDCNVTDNGERVGGFYWVTPKDNAYRFFKLAE